MSTEEPLIGADVGAITSWECQVDLALGQAARVLRAVTEGCEDSFPDPEKVEAAVALAQAWREVGEAWCERQTHEMELVRAEETEEEPVEEPVSRRQRR